MRGARVRARIDHLAGAVMVARLERDQEHLSDEIRIAGGANTL